MTAPKRVKKTRDDDKWFLVPRRVEDEGPRLEHGLAALYYTFLRLDESWERCDNDKMSLQFLENLLHSYGFEEVPTALNALEHATYHEMRMYLKESIAKWQKELGL